MDSREIVSRFTSLTQEATNVLPDVTMEAMQAAERLAGIEGGEDVLAVCLGWTRFTGWLVDKNRVTWPPRQPNLAFLVQHYLSVVEFLRVEGIWDERPMRRKDPTTIDGQGLPISAPIEVR
jgi:hypothetical protein